MSKPQIYIVIILLLMIFGLLAYYYLFNIYEVTFSVSPKDLYADGESTVTIKVTPLNALGFKALFRSSPAEFSIQDGRELVDIVREDTSEGTLVLRAKDKTGIVTVIIKPLHALLPSQVEINIYDNLALKN